MQWFLTWIAQGANGFTLTIIFVVAVLPILGGIGAFLKWLVERMLKHRVEMARIKYGSPLKIRQKDSSAQPHEYRDGLQMLTQYERED